MTLTRKTPMRRTGFKRKEPNPISRKPSPSRTDIRIEPDKFTTSVPVKRMRSRTKRPTVAEGSKYIDACRGEECYLRVPSVCCSIGWAHESVVDCHSNQSRHGKAGARKADNIFTVPGCGPCHAFIDQNRVGTPKQEKFDVWDRAYAEWEPVRARKMGLIDRQEIGVQPAANAA